MRTKKRTIKRSTKRTMKKRTTKMMGGSEIAYNELIMHIIIELNSEKKTHIKFPETEEPKTAQIIRGDSKLIHAWNSYQTALYEEKAVGESEEQPKLYKERLEYQKKLNKIINEIF
jgi:hypothetical protein